MPKRKRNDRQKFDRKGRLIAAFFVEPVAFLRRLTQVFFICSLSFIGSPIRAADFYDPLLVADQKIRTEEHQLFDQKRQRQIPYLSFRPNSNGPWPLLIFSHGLGGSRHNNSYLGNHWAGRGYLTIFIQHPGSDDGVWRDKNLVNRLISFKRAANRQNFFDRIEDVRALLDHLEKRRPVEGHPLLEQIDFTRIGMSGHSFGAITTQAIAGQQFAKSKDFFRDPRIKVALMMSPTPARQSKDDLISFSRVDIPWMLMTGTLDQSIIADTSPTDRLRVFQALPAGDKYQVVLFGAEHTAFSDRALKTDKQPRNPNHHRVILALSTAFWDAYLKDIPEAKSYLKQQRPKPLAIEDQFQTK